MKTVLVVDDERNIVELRAAVSRAGRLRGRRTRATGGRRSSWYERLDPDLVVLDLMLPGMDGMEVTREVRRRGETPIVMLTARGEDIDRIVGLEVGADDYLTSSRSTLASWWRASRRSCAERTRDRAELRPMEVGQPARRPTAARGVRRRRRLDLRPREFDLLAALARDPGVVWSRDDLLETVWGTDFPGETRTVDVHVSALRRQLGPDAPPIETVNGVGYRLVPPPRERPAA